MIRRGQDLLQRNAGLQRELPAIFVFGRERSIFGDFDSHVSVGRLDFGEVARAHIAGEPTGFLRLLCERASGRVVGCQVLGEGATDLVHLGQAAIANGATADFFVEQIFNFPTMTEAYRIAAFDILKQRSAAQRLPLALTGS